MPDLPARPSASGPTAEPPRSRPSVGRWIAIGLFVAGYMGFAAAFTMTGTRWGEYPEVLVYVVSGAIIVHVLLFATWAAFGPGPSFRRVAITGVACLLVACAEVLGASRRGVQLSGWPVVPLAVAASVFLLLTFVLGWVQRVSRWQIVLSGRALRSPARTAYRLQFGVRLFLLWITLAVCLLALYHSRCAPGTATRLAAEAWHDVGRRALLGVTLAVATFLPTLSVPWIALASPRPRRRAILTTALAWITFTLGAVLLATWLRVDAYHENVKWALSMQVGASAAGLVAAVVVRSCGYRMVRRKEREAATSPSCSPAGAAAPGRSSCQKVP